MPFLIGFILILSSWAHAETPVGQNPHAGVPVVTHPELERQRLLSSQEIATPVIESIEVDGRIAWERARRAALTLRPGQMVRLKGKGFGQGPEIDFSKVLLGNIRALERDLTMHKGYVDLKDQLFHEESTVSDSWEKEILSWSPNVITFRVSQMAHQGPLIVWVQKRVGSNPSNVGPGAFSTLDPITERITGSFPHAFDVVSRLGAPSMSDSIPVTVDNPNWKNLAAEGEKIFWAFDFNMGLVHHIKSLDWEGVLQGKGIDPSTGKPGDPKELFGAIPVVEGEVPAFVTQRAPFDPYPSQQPLTLIGKPLTSGYSDPSGFVGYPKVRTRSLMGVPDSWVGMSCASCHAQRITYESSLGKKTSKVFPGLPNSQWSMKWAVLGHIKDLKVSEKTPSGKVEELDRSLIIYSVPPGTGEHTLVRPAGEGSVYDNEFLFSPVAIPIITRHTPIRRALSRTEMIAGFEGSYIHAQEPDGSLGAVSKKGLQAMTAYMDSLDSDDKLLHQLALYRHLAENNQLEEIQNEPESEFLKEDNLDHPRIRERLVRGWGIFERDCRSCHTGNFGMNTDENMLRFQEVGTYFSPTLFQMQTQSVRTSILKHLYWSKDRGYLHDGHVKSLKDLVDPARCQEGTELYQRYYSLHPGTFKIPKGNAAQDRALKYLSYFSDVPWDTKHRYWDYQKMRREFGVREFGAAAPLPLPAAPHPWCAGSPEEVDDLVLYLLTL